LPEFDKTETDMNTAK